MKKKQLLIVLSWAAVIACMVAIFCFSHQPADKSQQLSDNFAFLLRLPFGSFIVRKGAHFIEFAGLCALICNALYLTFGFNRPIISFAATAVYAAADEIHQLFVEGRACRFFDWLVDCIGALTALLVIYFIFLIFKNKKGGVCVDG